MLFLGKDFEFIIFIIQESNLNFIRKTYAKKKKKTQMTDSFIRSGIHNET